MIKQLFLRNFQCHQRLDLTLDPGVNVIVGPSDVGKSAIIRALWWVVFNEPTGNAFMRTDSPRTSVIITTGEDTQIKRVRSKKDNYYSLVEPDAVINPDAEVEVFKAFGRTVPEPIQKALNMDRINFSRQMDPPFLLSLTPVQVARELNEIANLQQIDTTLKNVNAVSRKTNSDIRELTTFVEDLEESLELTAGIEDDERKLALIENMAGKAQRLWSKAAEIKRIIKQIAQVEEQIENVGEEYPEDALETIEEILSIYAEIDKTRKDAKQILVFISAINTNTKMQETVRLEIKSCQTELDKALTNKPCPLCGREPEE